MLKISESVKNQIIDLGEKLKTVNFKVATAESCTGGMIGAALTSVAGSSDWFNGGIIAYSNEIKSKLLSVSDKTLIDNGAVSSDTVKEMAKGAALALNADIAVSVSGIAGPGGGTKEKPVGLVYIGIYNKGNIEAHKCNFKGDRDSVRVSTTIKVLNLLFKIV